MAVISVALVLGACAVALPPTSERAPGPVSAPTATAPRASAPTLPPPASGRGGYYKDDGPHEAPPADLANLPDAVPRLEPLHRFANRPYTVLGRSYTPRTSLDSFVQTGRASWYGRRFHGNRTASGEVYDMHAMTAAHPTLPIPSYVRVTHLTNGRRVIVRVNDRGPFHADRIIDLSYAAALRLDYLRDGSADVRVELITPQEIDALQNIASATPASVAPTPIVTPVTNTPAPSVVTAGSARGVFVQLGAFASESNAWVLHSRLVRELGPLADQLQIVAAGDRWRLQLGPFNERADAQQAARQIAQWLGLNDLLVLER